MKQREEKKISLKGQSATQLEIDKVSTLVGKGQVAKVLEEATLWVDPKGKTLLKVAQEEEEEEIIGRGSQFF